MSPEAKKPKESNDPTPIGESFGAIRDEIARNAATYNKVAKNIIAHQTAMQAQGDPRVSETLLSAAEAQQKLTQNTLDHLENSPQPPEEES